MYVYGRAESHVMPADTPRTASCQWMLVAMGLCSKDTPFRSLPCKSYGVSENEAVE